MLQPPFFWKNVFFNWLFWNQKQWCWTKNITQNQEKTKIRKRDFKEKTRQETQKREHFDEEKKFQFNIFMLFFSRIKSTEERTKKKRQKQERKRKPKKKDKKEERKTRVKQRDRERESEKGGGQKRLREKERETLKKNQKMPFWGGKTGFFSIENKERKGSKKKEHKKRKQTKKRNKEGLGPSEVALRATSPDP